MISLDRATPGPQALAELDPESSEWVRSLSFAGPDHYAVVGRLHVMLLRAARAKSHRRGSQLATKTVIRRVIVRARTQDLAL